MSTLKSVRIVGPLAAAALILAMAGCGGGSSSPNLTKTTHPSNGPRHVQALMFLTTNPLPETFFSKVLPNITGVAVPMNWDDIETSQGRYDFTAFDTGLTQYLNAGAKVNIIVWPATEGGSNNSTPSYVFTQAWANDPSVNALNPLDMAVCGDYNGDSSNPFYQQAISGGGGVWNTSTSTDISGLPVSYEAPFAVAYKNFITAVVAHYNAPGTVVNGVTVPQIGYIRFGMSQGGESSPECNQYWPGPNDSGSFNETEYITYVTTMTQFVTAQSPAFTVLQDLHAVGDPGSQDFTYADQEAALAVANREGFGTNGLQQSDVASLASDAPCDSDWCALFAQFGSTVYGSTPITLSLQTLQWSDPTNVAQTGSLAPVGSFPGLVPFAQQNGADNLELYLADVGLAFDPGNYCGYLPPTATCPSFSPATYSSSYATVIQNFLEP
jgi:hypothetical protein